MGVITGSWDLVIAPAKFDTNWCCQLEFDRFSISSSIGASLSMGRDIRIKVCGVTTVEDARMVAGMGVDYIGVNLVEASPRRLSLEQARPICEQSTLPVVALFLNWEAHQIQRVTEALQPAAIQLVGEESLSLVETLKRTVDCELWKSVHLPPQGQGNVSITAYRERVNSLINAGIDAIILDTVVGSSPEDRRYGGTGQVSNWATASRLVEVISVRTFLAGGVNAENVRQAIELVHPYGVDLSSGVEISPGKKDPEKLRRLVLAARGAVPDNDAR